jgi:hypothetical protein
MKHQERGELRCPEPQPLVGSLTYSQIMSLSLALAETAIDRIRAQIAPWRTPETEPSIHPKK